MRGTEPIDIFVLDPANILVRQSCIFAGPYGEEEVISAGRISLDAVRRVSRLAYLDDDAGGSPREL